MPKYLVYGDLQNLTTKKPRLNKYSSQHAQYSLGYGETHCHPHAISMKHSGPVHLHRAHQEHGYVATGMDVGTQYPHPSLFTSRGYRHGLTWKKGNYCYFINIRRIKKCLCNCCSNTYTTHCVSHVR